MSFPPWIDHGYSTVLVILDIYTRIFVENDGADIG
jgi:hypothetical protein